jgi:phage-related minor tail protein
MDVNENLGERVNRYIKIGNEYVINPACYLADYNPLSQKLQEEKALEITSESVTPKDTDIEIASQEVIFCSVDFGKGKDKCVMTLMSVDGEALRVIDTIEFKMKYESERRNLYKKLDSISLSKTHIARDETIFKIKEEEVGNLRENGEQIAVLEAIDLCCGTAQSKLEYAYSTKSAANIGLDATIRKVVATSGFSYDAVRQAVDNIIMSNTPLNIDWEKVANSLQEFCLKPKQKKQNFREVLPKKTRKRKDWK